MTAFLINLDRHPDRLTAAQGRLSQAGVRAERVSAVDGTSGLWTFLTPAMRYSPYSSLHRYKRRGVQTKEPRMEFHAGPADGKTRQ